MTPQEQADSLLIETLVWIEKKHAEDNKRLKSILDCWGFRVTEKKTWEN